MGNAGFISSSVLRLLLLLLELLEPAASHILKLRTPVNNLLKLSNNKNCPTQNLYCP